MSYGGPLKRANERRTHEGEAVNRLRKAKKLAAWLTQAGLTAETVAVMNDSQWSIAAAAANTNSPSETTKAVVLELLREVQT